MRVKKRLRQLSTEAAPSNELLEKNFPPLVEVHHRHTRKLQLQAFFKEPLGHHYGKETPHTLPTLVHNTSLQLAVHIQGDNDVAVMAVRVLQRSVHAGVFHDRETHRQLLLVEHLGIDNRRAFVAEYNLLFLQWLLHIKHERNRSSTEEDCHQIFKNVLHIRLDRCRTK